MLGIGPEVRTEGGAGVKFVGAEGVVRISLLLISGIDKRLLGSAAEGSAEVILGRVGRLAAEGSAERLDKLGILISAAEGSAEVILGTLGRAAAEGSAERLDRLGRLISVAEGSADTLGSVGRVAAEGRSGITVGDMPLLVIGDVIYTLPPEDMLQSSNTPY